MEAPRLLGGNSRLRRPGALQHGFMGISERELDNGLDSPARFDALVRGGSCESGSVPSEIRRTGIQLNLT